jgi:hypothetical protein
LWVAAMNESTCKCGHEGDQHRPWAKGPCARIINERSWLDFDTCPCKGYDVSRLPEPGERLEFGRHRLNIPEAEAAPAWPSLNVVEGRNVARFKREQNKAKSA